MSRRTSRLYTVPCTRDRARDFVSRHHRHHRPAVQSIFNVAAIDERGVVVGVAMVGRPVARGLCDGSTAEVYRVATDGTANACSFLLGAARRGAFELGYRQIITYTLNRETGASLRGAGWVCDQITPGRPWNTRKRANDWPLDAKRRWRATRSTTAPTPIWPEPPRGACHQKRFVFGGDE